jgi:hypothetical protein
MYYESMKKILLINLLITLFLFSGCALNKKPQTFQPTKNINNTSVREQAIQSTTTQSLTENNKNETAYWDTYKNEKMGFKIDYLKSLKVVDGKYPFLQTLLFSPSTFKTAS